MPLIRAFVAIELQDDILRALGNVASRLREGKGGVAGRWVKPEGIHLTLKFLGDVPTERLKAIQAALTQAGAACRPFQISVGGLGCFPNPQRPRVVWVAAHDDSGRLLLLQKGVEKNLLALGFAREERPFSPHLTLARIRREAQPADIEALGQAVASGPAELLGAMSVSQVSLIRSDLRPSGASYTQLFAAPLAGSPDERLSVPS